MRRKALSFGVLALPAASALSLANFQLVTTTSLPIACQLAYDSTIPGCTEDDFNDGCTTTCAAGLTLVSANVDAACSGISVNSKSLLGIVMDGQVIAALCPNGNAAATTSRAVQVQPPVVSVTIPTDSRGVTGGLGLKTTSTPSPIASVTRTTPVTVSTSAAPVPVQSTIATTSRSVVSTTPITQTSSTPIPATTETQGTGVGVVPPVVATTSSRTTSSKATATSTPQPDRGSGGGSPFDINSNSGASGSQLQSMCGMMLGMFWAGLLLVQ